VINYKSNSNIFAECVCATCEEQNNMQPSKKNMRTTGTTLHRWELPLENAIECPCRELLVQSKIVYIQLVIMEL